MATSEGRKTVNIEYDDGTVVQKVFDEHEVADLTDAAMYGCGWFRYHEGDDVVMLNMSHVLCVRVMPRE